MRELGPCIICRQKFSTPHNLVWRIDSYFARIKEGDSELFHIDCSRCKSSAFVMIVPGPFHAKAVIQALTDLTKKDLYRMEGFQAFDADEVLEFYKFFNSKIT